LDTVQHDGANIARIFALLKTERIAGTVQVFTGVREQCDELFLVFRKLQLRKLKVLNQRDGSLETEIVVHV